MKCFAVNKIMMVSVGFVVAFMLGGAENANADFFFGTPMNLGASVNSPQYDAGPSISFDGLSLFFYSLRPGGFGGSGWEPLDLWVSTREETTDDWGTPTVLGSPVNSSTMDGTPCISFDGLSLFFDSWRSGGHGGSDAWMTTRTDISAPWGPPVNLGPAVNSSASEIGSCISADGLELYVGSDRPGGSGDWDIWVCTRETVSDAWRPAVNLGSTVNSTAFDGHPSISSDGLALFFCSDRGDGDWDIWMSRRATKDDAWSEPVNLGPMVNTSAGEAEPSISYDGRWLYFDDYPTILPGGVGGSDLWKAPILPIVDFNGDGIVDCEDMCIMVDRWGTDDSSCDIGPMPWGDGTVDVHDLTVLAEYLFQTVDDPTLVTHWPLDETEGIVAGDRVGDNDAYALGGAVWHPDGGQVGGALEFDGVDDFISTPAVLNPADGPFSVLVWIKGGVSGQAIISEIGGSAWLSLDSSEGHVMTELAGAGRSTASLISQTVINDGDWHRVGLVWDGSNRILCVDDAIVAQDTQDGLDSPGNGLYIGCGDPLKPDTFFSGLIDDIRIYNRAVKP